MITKNERYRHILAILARHGIGLADDEFIKHEAGDQARAEHLRHACEELGTLFIKLGQALSTRGDLCPMRIVKNWRNYRTTSPRSLQTSLQT